MTIVTVAWNLPLYEQLHHRNAPSFRATFNQVLASAPPDVAAALSSMLSARLTTYANDPRIGFAQVVEEPPGQGKIVASAILDEG